MRPCSLGKAHFGPTSRLRSTKRHAITASGLTSGADAWDWLIEQSHPPPSLRVSWFAFSAISGTDAAIRRAASDQRRRDSSAPGPWPLFRHKGSVCAGPFSWGRGEVLKLILRVKAIHMLNKSDVRSAPRGCGCKHYYNKNADASHKCTQMTTCRW